tara:strand:+ start:5061 stop:5672 length:612 start_codon:yes stop_codon:yes gene_type:complete
MLVASYSSNKYRSVQEVQKLQHKIYKALMYEFEDDLPKWSAKIDVDATVSFTGYNLVQFQQGKDEIEKKFKLIIDDFFPRYVSVIKRYDSSIRRIRIEGHTSSEWGKNDNEDDRYLKNLQLSQGRAFNVLRHSLDTLWKYEKKWIKQKLRSEGMSSSVLVTDQFGNEDKRRSRRTEFKIDIKHGDYFILKEDDEMYSSLKGVK